jgi:hypothetical protein
MEIIKKFTAVQINTKKVDDTVIAEFEYGRISGPYYDVTEPKTEFETEQEAIEWAYKEDEYADWLILTKVSFKREY